MLHNFWLRAMEIMWSKTFLWALLIVNLPLVAFQWFWLNQISFNWAGVLAGAFGLFVHWVLENRKSDE